MPRTQEERQPRLQVLDEGTTLSTYVRALDFSGAGVSVAVSDRVATVTIPDPTATITASILGKRTIWVPVDAMRQQTTSPCAAHTQVELTANQPELVVLDFDGTSAEFAIFSLAFPKSWNLSTIDARFFYVVNAAVSTTVTWSLQGVARSDGDAVAAAYGTAQSVTDTYLGTANLLAVTSYTSAITISGTPADGDLVYFRVARDPGTDSTTQDARLIGILIRYTVNALRDD